jgi:hypothetical protein
MTPQKPGFVDGAMEPFNKGLGLHDGNGKRHFLQSFTHPLGNKVIPTEDLPPMASVRATVFLNHKIFQWRPHCLGLTSKI